MLLIPIITIAIATGLVVFLFLNKDADADKHRKIMASVSRELEEKKTAFNKIERRLFNTIENSFGPEYIKDIQEGAVSKGMPAEFLMMAWGRPAQITNSPELGEKAEIWLFQEPNAVKGDNLTEVTLVNNKVQSWKDI